MSNRKTSSYHPRILIRSFWIVTFIALAGLVYILILAKDLPSIEQLENYDPDLVTRIYSADGKVLNELYLEKRVFVNLDQIPEHMRNAVIASEDRRFRNHWGISLRDFFRAVVINTISLSYRQGFSSLTQQLARNLYDTIGFRKTLTRKIKEGITAIQIERTYTKDEILEMYLNSVHFGHGTYGIQAAAKRYFGKNAKDLTLDESALLVGILPSPGPLLHPSVIRIAPYAAGIPCYVSWRNRDLFLKNNTKQAGPCRWKKSGRNKGVEKHLTSPSTCAGCWRRRMRN